MADAELFAHPDYPMPGHGRVWFAQTRDGAKVRLPEDKWDCLLDREYKIGYVRLGAVEMGLDAKVAEMLDGLTKQGCRALILDLRWCPGGYVTPGTRIAGLFLKDGAMIAKMDYRDPSRAGTPPEVRTPPGGGKFADLPLVLLVGQETVGGGDGISHSRPLAPHGSAAAFSPANSE